MPIDYSKYAPNWLTEIRPRILKRADNRCEFCGVPNYAKIWRHPHEDCFRVFSDNPSQAFAWYGEKYEDKAVTVVLTIAHLHDPNPQNCEDENLAALCNACHLRLDAKLHAMNIIRAKNAELEKAGQLKLF